MLLIIYVFCLDFLALSVCFYCSTRPMEMDGRKFPLELGALELAAGTL